jgi:hypothetical protein
MTKIIPLARPRTGGTTGGRPRREPAPPAQQRVYVLFTGLEETLGAIRVAKRLAAALAGRVTVVHFRQLDFGMPLEAPAGVSPAETDLFRDRLEAEDCDADVSVCLCRDARRALPTAIDQHSLVVIGGRHRWWPTPADRWRRTLEAAGHLVVFVDGDARA